MVDRSTVRFVRRHGIRGSANSGPFEWLVADGAGKLQELEGPSHVTSMVSNMVPLEA